MSGAFDAAAWLLAFEALDGWYVIGSDGRLTTGWPVHKKSDDQLIACRSLWHAMADTPDAEALVIGVIEARNGHGARADVRAYPAQ